MPEQPLLSIVIPAYNEATAIGAVIDDVARVLRDDRHELIVVDDGARMGRGTRSRSSARGIRRFPPSV